MSVSRVMRFRDLEVDDEILSVLSGALGGKNTLSFFYFRRRRRRRLLLLAIFRGRRAFCSGHICPGAIVDIEVVTIKTNSCVFTYGLKRC